MASFTKPPLVFPSPLSSLLMVLPVFQPHSTASSHQLRKAGAAKTLVRPDLFLVSPSPLFLRGLISNLITYLCYYSGPSPCLLAATSVLLSGLDLEGSITCLPLTNPSWGRRGLFCLPFGSFVHYLWITSSTLTSLFTFLQVQVPCGSSDTSLISREEHP